MRYRCTVCNWIYDEEKGLPEGGIEPGTRFKDLPEEWNCPICASKKELFEPVEDKEKEDAKTTENLTQERYRNPPASLLTLEPELGAILQKAQTGKPELSSMRSVKHTSQLDQILFNPGQLYQKPLRDDEVSISLSSVIGKNSRRPLEIDLPFFISHMSFGALSREAKIALAKGATLSGTASSSGEGGMLPEERAVAKKYIFEYSTGRFGATEAVMQQADAIEIKIGQAAKAGLGGHLPGEKVTEEIARIRGVSPGTQVISPANHRDINSKEDLLKKVNWLRELSNGVPIGIKLVAGNIEKDLRFALFAKPDFITFDCRGGSTGTAPTHIKDNFTIPLPYALKHIREVINTEGDSHTTLIVTGGIRTSGDIAKCLAMGADVVALGTVAMIGIGCEQFRQCHRGTCPKGVATQDPELRKKLDIDQAAASLFNLFSAYREELEDFVRVIGKQDIHALDLEDLVTLSQELSDHAGIRHA